MFNAKFFLFPFLLTGFILQSCVSKPDKQTKSTAEKLLEADTVASAVNIGGQKDTVFFKDTFVFDSYNDNGDYMILNAKKGKDLYGFINDENNDRSLLKGDICEITWKKKTIFISGDGETPEIADWLVSITKVKDGNVSKLRKTYKKELKYHWVDKNSYSESYLAQIYLLTEYYIANTKNKLINLAIKNKDEIEYSIEHKVENGRDYDVLGIGYTFEHRFTIMQWIYIDRETQKIYEYDLPNEKLTPFE